MMAKYIDADKLVEYCKSQQNDEWNKQSAPSSWSNAFGEFVDILCETPKEDVALIKHGHWEIIEYEYDYLECSNCGEAYYTGVESRREAENWLEKGYGFHYCPFCGAKNDGKEEEQG